MSGQVVLGIDLGTQQLKVIAVDAETKAILGRVGTSVTNLSRSVGAVEQDPEAWWSSLCGLTRQLVAECHLQAGQIAGIGFSGHMHSIVPLDQALRPVWNSIVWADTRSVEQATRIANLDLTIWNPSISAYSAPKILWLRDNQPDAYQRTHKILFPKDYLRLRMTGNVGTDYSDASGTLAWDFAGRVWDGTLLSRIGLPEALFAEPQDSSHAAGALISSAAEELGLPPGIPVAVGSGDVAAAVIGSGITRSNTLLINAGTAAQVIVLRDTPLPYQRGGDVRYLFELGLDARLFTMGALPSAGLSLEWWRKTVDANLTYQELEQLAGQTSGGADGAIFIPFLQGSGTPYLLDRALGTFVQMSANTNLSSLTRAVFEGVAFGIRRCAEALVAGQGLSEFDVKITGGITKSALMRELLASIFPGPVTYRDYSDVSLIGAAALGAVAGGAAESVTGFLGNLDYGERPFNEQEGAYARFEGTFERFRNWSQQIASQGTAGR